MFPIATLPPPPSELLICTFPSAIWDQGYDHPHPRIPNHYVRMQKLDSEEDWWENYWLIWSTVLEESSTGTQNHWNGEQVGPRAN